VCLAIIRGMATAFATELAQFGPGSAGQAPDFRSAARYCSKLAQEHYENFTVASLLLPRALRPHFHAIYAYCRWADDLGDETGGGQKALDLLAWWRQQLLSCYEGRPEHPVMVALARTIREFSIPPEPFLDLIQAFEQDQAIKEYETFDALLHYCRYSANPVGRLVLYVCSAFTTANAALSDLVCTGLQLANFWQDVSRDLDIGRVYLPAADRAQFGYTDEDLRARHFNSAFEELMRFQVERTRELFERGLPLVERVPQIVRIDIELFIRGGQAILRKIERQNYNVWRQRPALARWDKVTLLALALYRRTRLWLLS
jgi:squalene synthase HpnC